MPRVTNTSEDYASIKPLENKHNKFFIVLGRNSINVHSNTRSQLALHRIGDFWNFF